MNMKCVQFVYGDDIDKLKKIGCDGTCGKWFHYKCAGLKRMPSHKIPFVCSTCKQSNLKISTVHTAINTVIYTATSCFVFIHYTTIMLPATS